MTRRSVVTLLAVAGTLTVGVAAQQRSDAPPAGIRAPFAGKPARGNPTPGTEQPDPPNLADRVTLTGCVRTVSKPGGASAETIDSNTPSDARFVLADAERRNVVPPGTGRSELAAGASGRTYRLKAIESQLSPFVGARVEVSGEIEPPSSSATDSRSGAPPILKVEFVEKIAAACP